MSSTLGLSNLQSSAGVTNIPILNVNALYIGGILYDEADHPQDVAALQAQIDQINVEITQIEAITNRIDFNTAPALVGNLVVTETNKNSVLLTAIQALQGSIGELNKLNLSALPASPPGACVITTATTNQALNGLIATNTTDITTIQGQITTINNSITAINTKLAHFSTFSYGADVMSGIADQSGFAVALSGTQVGNGIFAYPNNSVENEQIQLVTDETKNLLIRGGGQVGIFAGKNSSLTTRNLIDIGDKMDEISIGRNHNFGEYPQINIGVDAGVGGSASNTNVEGDIFFSSFAGVAPLLTQTPLLYGDPTPGFKYGNTNNYTLQPVLTGLDVTAVGAIPITLTAVSGLILISNVLGGIALTCGGGAIAMTTGGGLCSITTGAGAVTLSTGAGIMNFSTGAGNMEMSTLSGNINIGAGKGAGGTAGITTLQAKTNVVIQPDVATEIYKTGFIEFNENTAPDPPITANRLYQQGNQLFFDGTALGGGGGNFVLKTGDTMTGALTLPEAITPIVTLTSLASAPVPTTNRLYNIGGVLYFNGAVVGGGGGAFVPLAGNATMTGALTLNYDAGTASQLNIVNTNTTAGTGGAINIRNDSAGAGSIGERCGKIDFAGRDSVGGGGRTYAAIQGYINDPTTAAIDGRLSSFVASNNTLTEFQRMVSTSTGVRQVNINAQNTTIGTSALGSASTETLRVQGSTAITTTLDVPLIQNAPAIYPATSTTLVDNAVRKYQPERLYRMVDYPDKLTPPTTDGEKVIILNNTGAPSGIDEIVKPADFPSISGSAMTSIIQVKYIAATTYTPACNFITAQYADGSVNAFVQADVAAVTLVLTPIGRFTSAAGAVRVNDFVVTWNGVSTQYLYFGGLFDTFTLPASAGGASVSSTNFVGRLRLAWAGSVGLQVSIYFDTMPSYSTTQDSGTFGNIVGVNAEVTSVINVTGNAGFPQPTPPIFTKNDSIVIAGDFLEIGAVGSTYRPLKRLAYYDYTNAGSPNVTLYSQPVFTNNYAQPSSYNSVCSFAVGAGGTYSVNVEVKYNYVAAGSAPVDALIYAQVLDTNNNVLSQSAVFPFNGNVTTSLLCIPPVLLSNASYFIRVECQNFNSITGQGATFDWFGDGNGVPYALISASLVTGSIGWRTFAGADWATPVGADAMIRGGGLLSSGYLGFTYEGNTLVTAPSVQLTSNRIFSVYYMSSSATFTQMNSDDQAIDSSQTWSNASMVNNVSGGNPTLAYGAGNATAYGELYCNRGFNNVQNLQGVYYRPSVNDPYEMTDTLIFIDNGFTAYQLKPQFGSQASISVYRDDATYSDTFWVARGNELVTATLPFQGGIPNYSGVSIPPSTAIPCIGFGGKSTAIGYQGLVLYTPANVYIYKGSLAGELTIELQACVVRCAINIYAQNKLTFPHDQDGTSITLIGDTGIINPYGKPSWWAIAQDGGIYYDDVFVNPSGITSVVAGSGIGVSTTSGAVTISNAGVTQLVAGSNITITGSPSGVGSLNIAATIPAPTLTTGYISLQAGSVTLNNFVDGNAHAVNSIPSLAVVNTFAGGIAANNWNLSGTNGQLRWAGANPIYVTMTLTMDINTYDIQTASPSYINLITDPQNGLYVYSNFGYEIGVYNSNGIVPYSPNVAPYICGASQISYGYSSALGGGQYQATLTYNCILKPQDWIYVQHTSNPTFNRSGGVGAGSYQAFFLNSRWTLNMSECSVPF